MANVLPKSFRDDIKSEYKLRFATAGLALLCLVLLAATILLAPSFILTESRLEQKQATLNSLSEEESATSTNQNKDIIARTNQKLSVVSQETNELDPTEIAKLVTQTKPTGVSVRRISIQESENGSAQTIDINGVARTRDDLLEFEDNLGNKAQVQEINLPIDTLASRQNAEFSLTLTAKKL
jgi:Tfp pilus assembly protein PilN